MCVFLKKHRANTDTEQANSTYLWGYMWDHLWMMLMIQYALNIITRGYLPPGISKQYIGSSAADIHLSSDYLLVHFNLHLLVAWILYMTYPFLPRVISAQLTKLQAWSSLGVGCCKGHRQNNCLQRLWGISTMALFQLTNIGCLICIFYVRTDPKL